MNFSDFDRTFTNRYSLTFNIAHVGSRAFEARRPGHDFVGTGRTRRAACLSWIKQYENWMGGAI